MRLALALTLFVGTLALGAAEAQQRKTPYWASISSGEALMRTGPGKNFPGVWLYRRADLPIKVLEQYPQWRKVQDPAGTIGWMQVNLLADTRSGIVTGEEARPLHEQAAETARILYRAEPGVVGRLSECTGAWCRFQVGTRAGYVRKAHVWGVDEGETF
jgi:SH3-like domain-containing protein